MTKDGNMKLAYSINEAYEAIGCGRTKLYQEIGAGKIKIRKLGNKTIIPAKELASYVDALPSPDDVAA